MRKRIYILAAAALGIQACNKTIVAPALLEGTYTGKFYHYSGSVEPIEKITVTFEGDRYSSSPGSNRQPAGGSGAYVLDAEKGILKFEDKNMWTADFDWNLILNGTYKFSIKGDSLIMVKTVVEPPARYEYRLKKN